MPEGANPHTVTDDSALQQQAGTVFVLLRDLENMQRELSSKIDRQHDLLESFVSSWQKKCHHIPSTPVVATPIIARQHIPMMDGTSPFRSLAADGYISHASHGSHGSQNSGTDAHTEAYNSALEDLIIERRGLGSKQSSFLFDDDEDLQGRRGPMTVAAHDSDQSIVATGSSCFLTCVQGQFWWYLCTIMILLNAFVMGWEIQLTTNKVNGYAESLAPVNQEFFDMAEIAFLAWMVFEVFVNIFKQRWDFIYGEDSGWNIFDVVLIFLSIGLQFMNYGSLSFLRVARLFHIGRLLRAFRVCKFLRSIRSVIISLSHSVRHLVSAAIVMGVFMYTTALIIMQEMNRKISDGVVTGSPRMLSKFFSVPNESGTSLEQALQLYGSIERTMMTLFMTISGGMEWASAAEPLAEFGAVFGIVWTAYISFMVFCVLNVLIGIFVDVALQAMLNDRDNMIHAQIEELNTFIRMIQGVFKTSDTDGSGTLSRPEFESLMQNEELITYLKAMGIDADEASGLFRYLDEDNSGTVTVDEFVTGFLRLKGNAKAVDVVSLLYESRKISRKMNKLFRETKFLNGVVSGMHYVMSHPQPHETADAVPYFASAGISVSSVKQTRSDPTVQQDPYWATDRESQNSEDEVKQDDVWLKPWRPLPGPTAKIALPKPSGCSSRSSSSSFSVPAEFCRD